MARRGLFGLIAALVGAQVVPEADRVARWPPAKKSSIDPSITPRSFSGSFWVTREMMEDSAFGVPGAVFLVDGDPAGVVKGWRNAD